MFIPVSIKPVGAGPSKFIGDEHVSLEQVQRFFTRPSGAGTLTDQFLVETDHAEYYVTKETYDLLKSLVLRP